MLTQFCELGKGNAKITMTNSIHNANKERVNMSRAAPNNIEPRKLQRQLHEIFAADCAIHLASPVEDLDAPTELLERANLTLIKAIPELERRDFIVMAVGIAPAGQLLARGSQFVRITLLDLNFSRGRSVALGRCACQALSESLTGRRE